MTSGGPVVVAYGLGRDSTALLIELWKRGVRPDAITWADVGSEKAGTYAYLPVIQAWLRSVAFPEVTVVRYTPTRAPYETIEGNMVLNATLPGATFGLGSCTAKFKIEPQNKWTLRWQPARDAWAAGKKVTKMIGFEAGEDHRLKRADAKAHSGKLNKLDASRYRYVMPLMEWGLTLAKCIAIIQEAGLPVPPKSACMFCPNQHREEVEDLTPDERSRVILIELSAEPFNQTVHGLWREPRKKTDRPGSITAEILAKGYPFTPLEEICDEIVLNPACGKFKNDGSHTFAPPHLAVSLRELLTRAGHFAPPLVLAPTPGKRPYRERKSPLRMADAATEDAVHQDIVESL